jgi:uncharacterized protein YraI
MVGTIHANVMDFTSAISGGLIHFRFSVHQIIQALPRGEGVDGCTISLPTLCNFSFCGSDRWAQSRMITDRIQNNPRMTLPEMKNSCIGPSHGVLTYANDKNIEEKSIDMFAQNNTYRM